MFQAFQASPSPEHLGWTLDQRDPDYIRSLMPLWDWAYHHYFRVNTAGWENITLEQPVLFVGSHNGGLAAPDMHMMMYDWFRRFGIDRPVYGLMHPRLHHGLPTIAEMAVKTGAVMAHPKMAIAALRSGASVLVYPGGIHDVFRPYYQRNQIRLEGNTAFIKLALREKTPIVPAISWGAHDSLIVLGDLYPLVNQLHQMGMPWLLGLDPEVCPLYLGLPWGIALGPLPNIPFPTKIYTRVLPAISFSWYGRDAANDRAYVYECYETVRRAMQTALDQLIQEIQPPSPSQPEQVIQQMFNHLSNHLFKHSST
ncbi:lysophospholipid acyltransferase family protein [Alkalinema sp. FACHB-956]|uniref:lysophospholipid acyltransferase family protein n=1 Tax=Alkalinema sp. FACHB-956 TaxID=2692768 RepID=UPI001F54E4F0|nr:lysophospholipid acyltransferase family protein [Alkalinema sp. FACHB-956]